MDLGVFRSCLDAVSPRPLLFAASALAACASAFAAPATAPGDPTVPVVRPTPARITRYLETTGTVAAMQSVDLVARISGTLESIDVSDGAIVNKGATLFTVEPLPYESKLRQAQAAEEQQRALSVQAYADYGRQAQLRITHAASQATVDSALAARDSTRAALQQAQEATRQAAITYTYTRVKAPFDGVMTARLVSVGELVGSGSPTKLATILQLDPVWINASISEADVLRTYQEFQSKIGKLDVLVNNAGSGTFRKLVDLKLEEFQRTFNTNVQGAMLMAREAAKLFAVQNSGNIVNIGSTASHRGAPNGTAYYASKFALRGMTECWRAELRQHNVRVMLVNPSEVITNFGHAAGFLQKANDSKLQIEDIAHAVRAVLEMDDRGFTTELTVFATNPKD